MTWQLIKVKQTKWEQDESGYYTLINYIKEDCRKCNKACINCIDGHVRLDIMDKDDMPVVSFQGKASDVRKHVMQHIPAICSGRLISIDHASYIGAELARCELLGSDYVQD